MKSPTLVEIDFICRLANEATGSKDPEDQREMEIRIDLFKRWCKHTVRVQRRFQ